jgi:hypothetical protein
LTTKRTKATRPLRSARITRPHRYYQTVRPCAPHRYSAPHRFRCLGCSLSPAGPTPARAYRGDRFPRFVPVPDPSSRHLCAGHHLANQQASARLVPGQQLDPGFDDAATLSTLPQWFTHVRLLGPHLTPSRAPFPRRSPPRLLTAAAHGGLGPPPARRSRRANLHHQHNTASEDRDLLHRNPLQRSWHTVSSREGSHLPALAEPDLNLSTHPAPIAQPSGRAPRRQCANRPGDRWAISASHAMARRSRRLSRLYFRHAHRTRCRLSLRRK